MMEKKIRLGISACLLGEPVRYDGGHRLDPYLKDTLGKLVEYVRICPEVDCGMPVPREPMQLVGETPGRRLVTVQTRKDVTPLMESWMKERLDRLADEGLSGFVFKARSPSCGIRGVRVYRPDGTEAGEGEGLFAAAFMERFPDLPVTDEDGMADPAPRSEFLKKLGI